MPAKVRPIVTEEAWSVPEVAAAERISHFAPEWFKFSLVMRRG